MILGQIIALFTLSNLICVTSLLEVGITALNTDGKAEAIILLHY